MTVGTRWVHLSCTLKTQLLRKKFLFQVTCRPRFVGLTRPTPRRHSLMQMHDELSACAPRLVAPVLGWRRGVGRLRRAPVA